MGNTCVKRSVLGAGDRQAAITRAAAAVQAATLQLTQRVQPHAGSPLGSSRGVGMAIPHSTLGGYNPIQDALRNIGNAVNNFAREVNNALAEQAREVAAIRSPAKVALRFLHIPYTEPMIIPAPDDEMTVATVICGRAVVDANPAEHLLNGTECDFEHTVRNQIKINSIDGMTPDPSKIIFWTFIYFGL